MENLTKNVNNPNNSLPEMSNPPPTPGFQSFVPLKTALGNLPPFPVDSLPPVMRDYVLAVAAHTQTVPDMAAAIGLGVLATCLQGKVRVEGNLDHYEQVSLYTLIIAPPGERKSATIREMTAVIEDYEQQYNERLKPAIRKNRQERESLQRDITRLTRQLEQKPDSMAELELQHAQDNLAELPVIKPVRFFADDCTSESLIRLLADNNGRMAVISAEGGVFDNITGRYSNKPNIDVWLKGISGDTIRVDRMNREPDYIRNPALSAVLTAQPSVLSEIMDNGLLDGRGMLARFLYVNIPASGAKVFRSPPVPPEVKEAYRTLICRLMDIPADSCITLHLSDEAVARMEFIFWSLEKYLAAEGMDIREWGKKLCGMMLRIAGLLHMAAGETGDISLHTLNCAFEIAKYALIHARYAFSMIGCDESVNKGEYVIAKLRRNRITKITRANLYQLCRGRFFHKAKEIDATLELLESHGYIRMEIPPYCGMGRPPEQIVFVNPTALAEGGDPMT